MNNIIQIGVAKSGNLWLYKIINIILEEIKTAQKSYIQQSPIHDIAKTWNLSYPEQADIDVLDITDSGYFYRISSIYRYPINDIKGYLNNCTHIWTHSGFCHKSNEVLSLIDKKIYIIRDPRDVLISMAKFLFTPYMQKYYPTGYVTANEYIENSLLQNMEFWSNHVVNYFNNKEKCNIYFIFYENFLINFEVELNKLLSYLNIELSQESKSRIKEMTSFSKMKENSKGHIRKAQLYGWKEYLNDEQNELVIRKIGNLLGEFNYPKEKSEDLMPGLPEKESLNNPNISRNLFKKTKLSLRRRLSLIKTALTKRYVYE